MLLVALVLLEILHCSAIVYPITLRVGVLHAPPFAIINDEDGSYTGFEPDLLKRLQVFAAEDEFELEFILSRSPPQYGPALDLVANDCNKTANPNSEEDCSKFDMIVGDYYCNPDRSVRVDFTPPWLRTTMSTMKYIGKVGQDYTTLTQASQAKETVCVPDGTYLMTVVMAKFPEAEYIKCPSPDDCIKELKAENCVLYVDDELLLRYRAAHDGQLQVTREQFNTQYLVWPMSYNLRPYVASLMKKWMYKAVSNATLDELYFKYFQKELCPVGTAGEKCELPCDPDHGQSNAQGICVCESTRWTGDDCSIEVPENVNAIPFTLIMMGYIMFGINVGAVLFCTGWLWFQRDTTQVRISQPFFLCLVLVGCLISSSTILVLGKEDSGDGPVHACAAIPWLYSVGFSITFGTLFAKIRRVYKIFKSAASMQRSKVTVKETLAIIGSVLILDVVLLIVWTVMDPLEWERTDLTVDKFGHPLESEGYCTSEYWKIFGGIIGLFHLLLMAVACYMCYVSRDIPTKFSEGKYLAVAMISNLQIFVVGVPVLILLGSDSKTSFFVRSVMIWMNDLVVVSLVFGNLIHSVHFSDFGSGREDVKAAIGGAIKTYSRNSFRRRSLSRQSSVNSFQSFRRQLRERLEDEGTDHNSVPRHQSAASPLPTQRAVVSDSELDKLSDSLTENQSSPRSNVALLKSELERLTEGENEETSRNFLSQEIDLESWTRSGSFCSQASGKERSYISILTSDNTNPDCLLPDMSQISESTTLDDNLYPLHTGESILSGVPKVSPSTDELFADEKSLLHEGSEPSSTAPLSYL